MFSGLFGGRDREIYPEDEYGDELHRAFPGGKLPAEALIWFDIYFEEETDADAIAAEFENRRCEINRDFDDEPDEGFGKWNIDVSWPIKPTYREIKANVEQMRDKAASRGGRLGSWLVMSAE